MDRVQSRSGYQGNSVQDTGISGNQQKVIAGFERLWVWQKAHQLMLEIHRIGKALPSDERFRTRDQIERSSSSVADNIAEGYTSYYYQDKIKGFFTARKEAGETQNHVRAIEGKGYVSASTANDLIGRYEEVIKGINGYANWVRDKRGVKR
ncbi:MAG: four helix bundle protein [Candidatus Margulisbacteria bacterium]|nr:four helix bundle protein [Candidatus Margulisiibacteriota bacterium]